MTTKRGRRWETKPSIFVLFYALKMKSPRRGRTPRGVYCIVKGYSAYGIALIIADLAALAGAFAYGTYKSSEERMRKWNEVKPPRE